MLPGFHSSGSGLCARSSAHLCGGTGRLGQPPAWLPFPVVRWWWTFGCFSKLVLKSTEACWVLAEICPCQTWHVSWCLAVTITKSPRGSPLKEAERDYDSFSSFTFELANTKGEGSMWAGSRAGSKKLGCTNDLKHQMWTNFILDGCSCDALFQHCVEQADFISSELTPFVLYAVWILYRYTTSSSLPAVFCFPIASRGEEVAVIKHLRC